MTTPAVGLHDRLLAGAGARRKPPGAALRHARMVANAGSRCTPGVRATHRTRGRTVGKNATESMHRMGTFRAANGDGVWHARCSLGRQERGAPAYPSPPRAGGAPQYATGRALPPSGASCTFRGLADERSMTSRRRSPVRVSIGSSSPRPLPEPSGDVGLGALVRRVREHRLGVAVSRSRCGRPSIDSRSMNAVCRRCAPPAACCA